MATTKSIPRMLSTRVSVRKFPRYLPAGRVVDKRCVREAKEIRRELTDLFEGFSVDPLVVGWRRAQVRYGRVAAKLRKQRLYATISVKPTTESWAALAAKKSTPSVECRSGLEEPKPSKQPNIKAVLQGKAMPYSSKWGKRTFWADVQKVRDERHMFAELAQAIAQRQSVIRSDQRQAILAKKVARQERLSAVRARLAWIAEKADRQPKQVDSFPGEKPSHYRGGYCPKVTVSGWSEKLRRKVVHVKGPYLPPTGKCLKTKTVWYEHDQQCNLEPVEQFVSPFSAKIQRRCWLDKLLSRTAPGRALALGYLRVKVSRMPEGQRIELIDQVSSFNDMVVNKEIPLSTSKVEPQMETGDVDKASNVAIQSTSDVDVSKPVPTLAGFKDLSISRETPTYQTLVDRWINMGSFVWRDTDSEGSVLWTKDLMKDILKNYKNSQNTQLFYTHRLVRCNVRLRFVTNANKFLVGMVMADVIYKNYNDNDELWDNRYTAWQRQHITICANVSNDAELVIPYRNVDSMIAPTVSANFAKVTVRVFNPLLATSSTLGRCQIAVFATIEDAEFAGMISRQVGSELRVEPQMESVTGLMNAGAGLINAIRGDPNRDNPPRPLQPLSLIPQSMTSLAYMDKVDEPINTLRADPRGQTPHADARDEMNPLEICAKDGFLQTAKWTADNPSGTLLFSAPVVPISDQAYPSQVTTSGRRGYVYSPMAYISSMYGKWRGDIEFVFRFVGSDYHTGSVMIGSVPVPSGASYSMENLKYSANKIVDISDSKEVVYRVPWQWFNSFADVRRTDILTHTPSRIFVYVVNPISNIAQVTNTVYMNVFVRAASNFELALPRAPILDPCLLDQLIPPSTEYLKPWDTEVAWYTTWNRNVKGNTRYPLVFYHANETDGWVGYTNVITGAVYELQRYISTNPKLEFKCEFVDNSLDAEQKKIRYGVYHPGLSTANAHGLIIAKPGPVGDSLKFAKILADNILKGTATGDILEANCVLWAEDGPWSQVRKFEGNSPGPWITATNDLPAPSWLLVHSPYKPNMDSAPTVILEKPTASSSSGNLVFGERTPDLKSICRRYIHCGSVTLDTCIAGKPRDCPYSARIKVYPIRELEPESSASFDNRFRHGAMTTIGSMYRGWRGGLRYRFVVVGNPPEGTVLYVSHRYDICMMTKDSYIQQGPSKVSDRDDMLNTHYATFAQVLNVNGSFSVEVPYYSEKEFLSTMPNADADDAYNGSLYLFLHSKTKAVIHLEIFMSAADDFRYSVFQGTPVSIDLNTLADEPKLFTPGRQGFIPEEFVIVEPQMATEEKQGWFGSLKSPKLTTSLTDSLADVLSKVGTKALQKTVDNLAEGDRAKVDLTMPDIEGATKEFSTDNFTFEGLLGSYNSPLGMIAREIIHCILSRDKYTIAFSIFNIIMAVLPPILTANRFMGIMTSLLARVTGSSKQTQVAEPNAGPEEDESPIMEFARVLCHGLAVYYGIVLTDFTTPVGIAKGLFSFGLVARGTSYMIPMLKDVFRLIKRCITAIASYFGTYSPDFELFRGAKGDDRLLRWMSDVSYMRSPAVKEALYEDNALLTKVFELSVTGRMILSMATNESKLSGNLLNSIRQDVKFLTDLETELVTRTAYCGVRLEPVCVWACGEKGTGKTHYCLTVADKLARMSGYVGRRTIDNRSFTQKFWDTYTNQPVVFIDDFLCMKIGIDSDLYGQFIQMKTGAMFNPPYSRTEDKARILNFPYIFVTSNMSHVQADPAGIADPDPFNRRRDLLLKFEFVDSKEREFKSQYTGETIRARINCDNVKQIFSTKQLDDLEHVRVLYAKQVTEAQDPQWTEIVAPAGKTRREAVDEFIISRAIQQHEYYVHNYKEACAEQRRMDSLFISKQEKDQTLEQRLDQYYKDIMKQSLGEDSKAFKSLFTITIKKAGKDEQEVKINVKQEVAPPKEEPKSVVVEPQPSTSTASDVVAPVKENPRNRRSRKAMNLRAANVIRGAPMSTKIDLSGLAEPQMEKSYSIDKNTGRKIYRDRTESRVNPTVAAMNGTLNTSSTPPEASEPQLSKSTPEEGDQIYIMNGPVEMLNVLAAINALDESVVKTKYPWMLDMDYEDLSYTTLIPKGFVLPVYEGYGDQMELLRHSQCLHEAFLGREKTFYYEASTNCFVSPGGSGVTRAVPFAPCLIAKDDGLRTLESCSMVSRPGRFVARMVEIMVPVDDAETRDFLKKNAEMIVGAEDAKDALFIRHEKLYQKIYEQTARAVKPEQEKLTRYQRFKNWLVDCWSGPMGIKRVTWITFCSILSWIFIAAVLLGSFVAAMFAYEKISQFFRGTPAEPEIEPSGDYKNLKTVPRSLRALGLVKAQGTIDEVKKTEEGLGSRETYEGALNKIRANTFFLRGEYLSPEGVPTWTSARCIGLGGRKFIVLKHYMQHFHSMGINDLVIQFSENDKVTKVVREDIAFWWTEDGYGVGEFPAYVPRNFKNIVKLMPSSSFSGTYASAGIIVETLPAGNHIEHAVDLTLLKNPISVSGTTTMSPWKITQGFSYPFGGKGRCGCFVLSPKMATPLVAIHTAGIQKGQGFSELLFRETFEPLVRDDVEYVKPDLPSPEMAYKLDGEYVAVGKLPPDMQPSFAQDTRIEPSTIHGVFPIKTAPAPLHGSDPRLEEKSDIFKIGVSKRCKPLKEFPKEFVRESLEDLKDKFLVEIQPLRASVTPLSIKEAVEGFPIEGYEAMEMTTSEGYPWVLTRPKWSGNKSWMFERSSYPDGRLLVTGVVKSLAEVLEAKHALRRRGCVPATYFTACLKDARILLEKISIPGKTRIFEMSPVDLTIAQRQFFLDFYAAYRKCRSAEHTIGINPDGHNWTELVTELSRFPNILTADYSGYGPSASQTLLEGLVDIQIAWLEKHEGSVKDHRVRVCIKHEIIHGYHVAKNLVFLPSSGLPSGNAATVELNSGTNSLYIRIAYLGLAYRYFSHYADMFSFYRFVILRHNGDDLIMSVDDEIIEWFNNATLIEYFAEFGLKMTDALKSGKVQKCCRIEEATYLKRGFLPHPTRPGNWLAPLEEASITDTANWVWKSMNKIEASKVNSEMCARLSYTRGPSFYKKIVTTLKERWARENVRFMAPSWSSLDGHVWEGLPGPKFSFE